MTSVIENRKSKIENARPSTGQRKLVLDDQLYRPLITIESARSSLPGHDEDDIIALIDEGFIPWAWNIALKPGRMARELRLLPECVEHYRRTYGSRGVAIDAHLTSIDRVIAHLLKFHDKPFILSTDIRLILNCGSTHVTNLVDAKVLKQLPGTDYRRGPNGAACVTRESLEQFLTARLEDGSL
jgi:hypothetical protein